MRPALAGPALARRRRSRQLRSRRSACPGPGLTIAQARQLALQVRQRYGDEGQALHDWLLQLEAQRYAGTPAGGSATPLARLKKQYASLSWPA